MPFSKHMVEHVLKGRKQITRRSSPFIEACENFNNGVLNHTQLVEITSKEGFKVVLDKFHNLNSNEIPTRFFIDERKGTRKGIRLHENIFKLVERKSSENLLPEVEARWRLVETAWELAISRDLISVNHDSLNDQLYVSHDHQRVDVTSSRHALNGYQKSRCFYCFDYISIISGSPFLADVDHFFPHRLKPEISDCNLDGVWNLVLSCVNCNRSSGKWDKVPSLNLLARLNKRNEYLISSNHPLKETIIKQTGSSPHQRTRFLQSVFNRSQVLLSQWEPELKADPIF